jgi:hypothetical protein
LGDPPTAPATLMVAGIIARLASEAEATAVLRGPFDYEVEDRIADMVEDFHTALKSAGTSGFRY